MLQFTNACIRHRFELATFIRIFLKENYVNILIWISLKFRPESSVNNLPTLVDIMAWRRSGDRPVSKRRITYILDTWMHHWVNVVWSASSNYLNQFWFIVHYTPRNKSRENENWIILVSILIEGCDISMFILVTVRNGYSHSVCNFHSLTHLCCDKMAVVLHMIFANAFLE